MFSKEDFFTYFHQVSTAERNAVSTVDEASLYLRDEPWAGMLDMVKKDAHRHRQMLEAIAAIFTEHCSLPRRATPSGEINERSRGRGAGEASAGPRSA